MPVYEEKQKVNGKSRYFIRTYVIDEFGNSKQIKRHNKKWIGRDGKNLAMQEEARLKNEYTEFETSPLKRQRITLVQLQEKYLDYLKGTIDNDTLDRKRTMLNHYCQKDKTGQVKTYPNIQIDKIDEKFHRNWQKQIKTKIYPRTSIFYEDYYYEWKKDEKERRYKWIPYSIQHLNRIQNVIVLMFDFAVNSGFLKVNPLKNVKPIGTPKEIKFSRKRKEFDTITFDEKEHLMEATVDDSKFNTLFDLWFSRGPRPGEIRNFKVKDYDNKKAQLMVNHTLSKDNKEKDPKTPNSHAPIDLGERLNKKINDYVDSLKKQPDFNEEWYLFGNKFMPISSNCLNHNKNKYFELAGINKHLRLQDFRHSCATWLFSKGVPLTVIARILRHKNIEVTMRVYTHLIKEDYDNVIMALG